MALRMPILSGLLTEADTDDTHTESLSHRLRSQRFAAFERATEGLPRPLTILDVGGTADFWEQRGWADRDDVRITLLNLEAVPTAHANIASVEGDACDLERYGRNEFEVAFSNSCIEHVGDRGRQARMAAEMRRVGRLHWVQTPNYWFPLDPHVLIPAWQYIPDRARVALLARWEMGTLGRYPDREDALKIIRGTRMLGKRRLRRMFPNSQFTPERIGPFVKSWTMHGID